MDGVDTTAPTSEQERHLTPDAGGRDRVIVVLLTKSTAFPFSRGREAFLALAEDGGWHEHQRIGLPDGGTARILTRAGVVGG
jgi:hypothetical protein